MKKFSQAKKEQVTLKYLIKHKSPKLKQHLFKSKTQRLTILRCFSPIGNKLLILLPPIPSWAYNTTSQKKIIIVVKANV